MSMLQEAMSARRLWRPAGAAFPAASYQVALTPFWLPQLSLRTRLAASSRSHTGRARIEEESSLQSVHDRVDVPAALRHALACREQ
jgi:hypothetical protein